MDVSDILAYMRFAMNKVLSTYGEKSLFYIFQGMLVRESTRSNQGLVDNSNSWELRP